MENITQQQRISQATADRLEIEIDMLSAALRHSVATYGPHSVESANIHQNLVASITAHRLSSATKGALQELITDASAV